MLLILATLLPFGGASGQHTATAAAETDLDVFMSKALAKREIDWNRLRDYVFREKEILEVRGGGSAPLESLRREYIWLVREGYLVRSPLRANGVAVSREEQEEAERKWIESRRKKRNDGLEREAFFGFKFEPGRYLLSGKRDFQGREVLVVEYYPQFRDKADPEGRKRKSDDWDRRLESMFEKTFLVTMLILPHEHQIVQMTFDNVGLDFLPGRWLVRLDDIKAELTMHQPFEEIWLPLSIRGYGQASTANGSLAVHYSREFSDYQKTDVKVRFWYEKPDQGKQR
jgi:hypothetical protein